MTYSAGFQASAYDYMAVRGQYGPADAYPDDYTSQFALGALLGVGYGSRGYGLTTIVIPAKSTGDLIKASDWTYLFSLLNLINNHLEIQQYTVYTVNADTIITALDGRNDSPHMSDVIRQLDVNRYFAAYDEMTLTNVLTSVRTSPWNYESNVYHEFTIDFGSEDAARYFFNTGSAIYMTASLVPGPNDIVMNSAVETLLADMGTIDFSAVATTFTGIATMGYANDIGYYALTDSYQQLFAAYGPTTGAASEYKDVSYILQAKRENYYGVNGGNGSVIRFQAIFRTGNYTVDTPTSDPYWQGWAQLSPTVSGTLTSTISSFRSAGTIVANQPTFTTIISVGP